MTQAANLAALGTNTNSSGAIGRSGIGYDGAILQQRQFVFRNPVTVTSGTQATYVNTGLVATITPTASTSFIGVIATFPIAVPQSGQTQINSVFRTQRKVGSGSYSMPSQITSNSAATLTQRGSGQAMSFWWMGTNWSINQNTTLNFLDNPSTTQVVSYTWDFYFGNNTGSFALGYNYDTTSNEIYFGLAPAAMIQLVEISNAGGTISINSTSS
jgi:hypothetical protein